MEDSIFQHHTSPHAVLWYWLLQCPGIGPAKARWIRGKIHSLSLLIDGTPSELENRLGNPQLTEAIIRFRSRTSPQDAFPLQGASDIRLICIEDPDFPAQLAAHTHLPPVICIRGNPAAWQNTHCVTIVGTRKPSVYGSQNVIRIIEQMPERMCIVSGMALGIDGDAHRAALRCGLATVAVLGSGLDDSVIYPRTHLGLAHNIIAHGGVLVSVHPPMHAAETHDFPNRNHILAGFSKLTVVIESELKGGSLITAKAALDMGLEVGAVPGAVDNKKSDGCNELISQGAHVIRSAKDILHIVAPQESANDTHPSLQPALSAQAKAIAEIISLQRGCTFDELLGSSGYAFADLARHLNELELAGCIINLPDGRIGLKK